MRRVVSLWLPHWQTDRRRRTLGPDAPRPEEALVTTTQDGNRRVIAAVDEAATRLGLRLGIAVAQAQAAIPGLILLDAQPEADADALTRLARWCHGVTPLAAPDQPDGIWLDVAGCAHLWRGGETGLLEHLRIRLARDGITARAAIADTPGAAHALARFGEANYAPPGAQETAVAPLPIAALRLDPALVATLRRLGFERIADLARIPRPLLARRFGPEPGRRLDQAHGALDEPIQPLTPNVPLQHRLAFLEPLLTADALSTATAHLLAPLCAQMEREGLGARRLDLLFERVDGAIQATRIGTALPSRDPAHLRRLLDEHLDRIEPGLGIDAMVLVVRLPETLRWRQADTTATAEIAPLVDRLANRLGPSRVYRAAPVESDIPERSVRRLPALAEPCGTTWPGHGPAPARLFTPPRPVDAIAELPDRAPAVFTWGRVRHRIRRADGPERIYGEWWRDPAETQSVRDYFRVEDQDGRRFLLFREGDGLDPATGDLRWFVQGLY